MILISKKKIENSIKQETISMRDFMIYSFISLGSFFSLFRSSKYPVVSNEYVIAQLIVYGVALVWVIGFILCYKIVKERSVMVFAYTIVPLLTVLKIRYSLFIMIPLVIINVRIIRSLGLCFSYWNAINSQIIGLIVSIITVSSLLRSIKRLFNGYDQ